MSATALLVFVLALLLIRIGSGGAMLIEGKFPRAIEKTRKGEIAGIVCRSVGVAWCLWALHTIFTTP